MNIVQKEINLNVRHPTNYQVIHAMQGDNDTIEITATIFDGNTKYAIDCDKIEIDCLSPTGIKHALKEKGHTTHTVTFLLDKNVLSENGKHVLSVHFMSKPNVSLTTFPSILFVCNAPLGSLSKSEFVTITEYVFAAQKSAEEAKASSESAAQSAANAKQSETNAKKSEENAAASTTLAAQKANEASASADTATKEAGNAKSYAENAKTYQDNAKKYSDIASQKATEATNSATAAAESAQSSSTSAATSASNAEEAKNYALEAKSYAKGGTGTRANEDSDNAKYYYEQIKTLVDDKDNNSGNDTNILYYETYEEFQNDLDAGNILNGTLILIKDNNWDDNAGNPGNGNNNTTRIEKLYLFDILDQTGTMTDAIGEWKLIANPPNGGIGSFVEHHTSLPLLVHLENQSTSSNTNTGVGYLATEKYCNEFDFNILDYSRIGIRYSGNLPFDHIHFNIVAYSDLATDVSASSPEFYIIHGSANEVGTTDYITQIIFPLSKPTLEAYWNENYHLGMQIYNNWNTTEPTDIQIRSIWLEREVANNTCNSDNTGSFDNEKKVVNI